MATSNTMWQPCSVLACGFFSEHAATRAAGSAVSTHVGTWLTPRGCAMRTYSVQRCTPTLCVIVAGQRADRGEVEAGVLPVATVRLRWPTIVHLLAPSAAAVISHALTVRTHKRPRTLQWSRRLMPKITCLVTLFFFLCNIPVKPESDALVSHPLLSASFYEIQKSPVARAAAARHAIARTCPFCRLQWSV